MASAYVPPAGQIQVVGEETKLTKCSLPASARAYHAGSPMWNNTTGGVEPALQQTGATSATDALQAFAALFVGFANGGRVSQQDGGVNDASQPFQGVLTEGIATAPCAALSGQHEIGEFVTLATFKNEGTTGFTTPAGVLTKTTTYYCYDNKVALTTVSAEKIGVLCERVADGATQVKFRFIGKVVNV